MTNNKLLWLFVIYFFFYCKSANGYFDKQPKFISEDGNLIIESALDHDICLRLRGTGHLKINDKELPQSIINGDFGNFTSSLSSNVITEYESFMNQQRITNAQLTRRMAILSRNRSNSTGPAPAAQLRRLRTRVLRLETLTARLLAGLETDLCVSNPCQNGGKCHKTFESFRCECTKNWDGTTCTEDVNECAAFAGTDLGCQNGAVCINSPGSYSCHCSNGWFGLHCTQRTVNCLSSSSGELCGHGTCVQTNDAIGYKCICDQGWATSGNSIACTVDVDECLSIIPHCSKDPPVQCVNLPGSFMCGFCPAGFTGNGHYCVDINECETNNLCSKSPTVECINTRGSYHCGSCPSGYIGDGKTCTRSNEIDNSAKCAQLCSPLARCIQLGGGQISCVCPPGYVGNGYGATGGCIVDLTDPCHQNQCLNGATCIANGTSYECKCPPGFNNKYCNVRITGCHDNPCRNGGSCAELPNNGYSCRCLVGFDGPNCETEVRACGGIFQNPSGILRYPTSATYSHNSRCAWLIRTNVTQVLNITFNEFNLEESAECRYDWLQIHDGRSSASYMIGRFCGNKMPNGGQIISSQNTVYLWFRSDNSTAHSGFELKWESIPPVCGETKHISTFGVIKSPGSPGNYPPDRDCEWHLMADPGNRIQLHFFTMQLETHPSCEFDFLAIYDDLTTNGALLAKYCNTSHPEPLTTSHNEVTIHFHSDSISSDGGFQLHYSMVPSVPGCGGTFTATSDEFGAPIKDGNYQSNLVCEYLIRLPIGNRIQIKFKQFKLENSHGCDFDSVKIYEGSTTESPLIGKFCGSSKPREFVSEGNTLLFVFTTDWTISDEGFRVGYDVYCGGNFNSESTHIITSPFYPENYQADRICIYEIDGTQGTTISLEFTNFDIEKHSDTCDFDSVKIYDGHISNSTQLGTFCGDTKPPILYSTQNSMIVVFTSDGSISMRGFKANFSFIETNGCGGIIKTLGQEISPPTRAGAYYHGASCSWTIIAPPKYIVQLTFTLFQLESSDDCSFDSVSLYDGPSNASHLIGKYCGNAIPPVVRSNENTLNIQFVSDISNSGDGFIGTYNFIDATDLCGGSYYQPTGNIKSPNYPSDYKAYLNCEWTIKAAPGKIVELNIKHFNLEVANDCNFDYLELRNGDNAESALIGKFCGNTIPPKIRSFTNLMYIKFVSDSSAGYSGFDIEFDSSLTGCGGTISGSSFGSITSPNYPNAYHDNSVCEWRIIASKGSIIQLAFADIQLEPMGTECMFDELEIHDGQNAASNLIGKYCTMEGVKNITSTSNAIFLRLNTDFSYQGRGFDLRFNTICSKQFTGKRGVIESPNYPNSYPENLDCKWTIKAPKGNKIYIAFSAFKLEELFGNNECTFDYLKIEERDSDGTTSLKHMTYCESNMPKPFTSLQNIVEISFITDASFGVSGFHLEYEFRGCGDTFHKPEGHFTSPNYPQEYPRGSDCEWEINVPFGNLIELTIHDYDLQPSAKCDTFGLHITNARNETITNTTYLYNYCGRIGNHSEVITSNSNQLFIKFTTSGSYSSRGFNITYKTHSLSCGGKFTTTNGYIMSPSYPKNYGSNLHCEWLIETDNLHTISLKFEDFNIEAQNNCNQDEVQVYNGGEKIGSNLIGSYCGSTNPPILRSTGNQMLVVMLTDLSIELSGFKAKYERACGSKIFTDTSGVISYTNNMPTSDACNWTIISNDLNKHVILTILHNYSPTSQSPTDACSNKINVYDGESTNATLKKTICGQVHPPPITSTNNALSISLVIPSNLDSLNIFEAHYSVLDNNCGHGVLKARSGKFSSPNYPNSYPLNIECVWTVLATPGNQIVLNIESMDIVKSEHCNEDYLEVRETNESGKLIGVFCDKDPPMITTPMTGAWIKFRSNDDNVGLGFIAQYSYATSVELSGQNGIVTSPLYPNYDFMDSDVHTYRIMVNSNSIIKFTITDLIIKSMGELKIFDGYNEMAVLLGDYKSIEKTPIESSSNIIYIYWNVRRDEGLFRLEWFELEKSLATTQKETKQIETYNCTENSLITVSNRIPFNLSSPGFPYGYPNSLSCKWTIVPGVIGYHVALTFDRIDLEDVTDCYSDSVTLSKSSDLINFDKIGKFCSQVNVTRSAKYHGNPNLKLEFFSDYYNNRTGFNTFIGLACGGELTGKTGRLTKSMVGTGTLDGICEYLIKVRTGRTIKFNFELLNLNKDNNNRCTTFIIIRNGHTDSSPYLGDGQYCGSEIPQIPNTISNYAHVQYHSPNFLFKDDFILTYEEISSTNCGETITLTQFSNETIIQSPNYPNIPKPFTECFWTIIVPNGDLLRIDFLRPFDLRNENPCTEEYVELRDGATDGAAVIGRYCGDQVPSTQFTMSNILTVKFFTEAKLPKNGFQARISIGHCGGFVRSDTGFIQSPNYPILGAYPLNSICDYRIIGRTGATLNITFLDLQLPQSFNQPNCNQTDHIILYNILPNDNAGDNDEDDNNRKINETQPLNLDEIGKYCGTQLPPSVISNNNELLVRFITKDKSSKSKGFKLSFNSTIERCFGDFNVDTGIITSPGYPVGRSVRQFCEWRITVPKGRRVRIEFLDFDFLTHDLAMVGFWRSPARRSFNQRLSFYNDFQYGSRIQLLTATDIPQLIYSTDNKMLISMWLRSNIGHRGFKLKFTSDEPSLCAGDFNGDFGTIESPKNTSTYNCEYMRQPSLPFIIGDNEFKTGTLAIHLHIYQNVIVCLPGFVPITIWYSKTMPDTQISTICTGSVPEIQQLYVVPFQSVYITAKQSVLHTGYKIDYKINNCGGILDKNSSYVIVQPNPVTSAGDNGGEMHCAWQFIGTEGTHIKLDVEFTNLNCESDFINIHNGLYPTAPLIERVCNSNKKHLLFTQEITQENLYIQFNSNNYNENITFTIKIDVNYDACGGILRPPFYSFKSPLNGTQYPNNIECEWIIESNVGYRIGLEFTNRFYLEQSENCTNDFVSVYDKPNIDIDEWKLIDKFCGRNLVPIMNATNSQMKIVFRTNNNQITGDGFTARWTENCGGVFEATKELKYLTSPKYPNNYPKDIQCNYTIIAPSGQFINIEFLDFILEDTSRFCNFDNLTIYKYTEYSYPERQDIVGSYCWANSLKYMRYKQKVNLILSTDKWIEQKGFKLTYSLDQCGGDIKNQTKIMSPKNALTNLYHDSLECVWNITAPIGQEIIIRFDYFDVEGNDYCYSDSVEIYEGNIIDSSKRMALLCGNITNPPPVIKIKSNQSILKFHSDYTNNRGGFSAQIIMLPPCDSEILLTVDNSTAMIVDPFSGHPNHLDCHFTIRAPAAYVIALEFQGFHVAPCEAQNTSCHCNFVEVRDGAGPFSEQIGERFCGYTIPKTVTSTGSTMWIRYATDSLGSRSNFVGHIKMEQSICGSPTFELNTTIPMTVFNWPGNSKQYLPNMRCNWKIIAPYDSLIVVSVERLQIQETNTKTCDNDYLELVEPASLHYIAEGLGYSVVYSGQKASKNAPSFYYNKQVASTSHYYCGTGKPNDFISGTNELIMKFKSDDTIQDYGFTVRMQILKPCNRNFTSFEGRIMSKTLADCETHITLPENYTISLYFSRFNIYTTPNYICTNDTSPMKIYDGNNLVSTICPPSSPPPIFSNTSHITIKFKDIQAQSYGMLTYDITYLASDKGRGCGGELFNYGGTFTSPLYPTNDHSFSDCKWIINVPKNLIVALQFEIFDMGSSNVCKDNYLQVIELINDGKDEEVAREYCGTDLPSNYTSTHNRLIVRFKKSANFPGTGWIINFMAIAQNAIPSW